MSYIRSADTYAFLDSDGNLVIHTNRAVDHQSSANIGSDLKFDLSYRYLITIPHDEFRKFVGEILRDTRPPWYGGDTEAQINQVMDRWDREREELCG